MKLTKLQLEIQKLGADKSLSFGCILKDQFRYYYVGAEDRVFCYTSDGMQAGYTDDFCDNEIIGKPLQYSRLNYLYRLTKRKVDTKNIFIKLTDMFIDNPELYNQTVFERPEELQLLVRDFLLSLK